MNRAIDEWFIYRTAHPNTLLIGSQEAAAAAISQHLPDLRAPLAHWTPRSSSAPIASAGTLVIRDVDTLDRTQQDQLFDWLDRCAGNLQVISITESALFPLVEAGAFLEKLYYRLNVICLSLTAHGDTRTSDSSRFVAAHADADTRQLTMQ